MLKDISEFSIDLNFNISFWTRIISFWTMDSGGSLVLMFNQNQIRIGNGRKIEEVKYLTIY